MVAQLVAWMEPNLAYYLVDLTVAVLAEWMVDS